MAWSAAHIPDLSGRLAVVTGGNGGLGLETVRQLADHQARVVIGARNMDKARRAISSLDSELPGREIAALPLDLASLASVARFSRGVLEPGSPVDILVNNAGIMAPPRAVTEDGFELQLGVNHLGHFALTGHLLEGLARSPAGRVINVTSFARHHRRRLTPDPHSRHDYDPWRAYGLSKMANLWFTLALDQRLVASGSAARSLVAHPGLTNSDLQAESVRATGGGLSQRFWHGLASSIGMSTRQGALPLLRAATDPSAQGSELYAPRWVLAGPPVRRPILPRSRRQSDLDSLWRLSEDETGVRYRF